MEVRTHDCFDFEEAWDQDEWFALNAASGTILQKALADCPKPLSEACACKVHRSLRETSSVMGRGNREPEGNARGKAAAIALVNELPVFVEPDAQGKAAQDAKSVKVLKWITAVLLFFLTITAPFVFRFWAFLVVPLTLLGAGACYLAESAKGNSRACFH